MQNCNFLTNISKMFWLLQKDASTETETNPDHLVREADLNQFVPELQHIIQQLDRLLAMVYRDTKRTDLKDQMDQLITELKSKKAKIEYLTSFNKSATEKIEAMEKDLDEQDKKFKELEIEKSRINKRAKGLRERLITSRHQPTTRNPYNFKIPLPASKLTWPKIIVDKKIKVEPTTSSIQDVVLHLNQMPVDSSLNTMSKIDEEDLDTWDDITDYETDVED